MYVTVSVIEWTTQPSVTLVMKLNIVPDSVDDRDKIIQFNELLPLGETTTLVGRKACLKPVTGSAVNE